MSEPAIDTKALQKSSAELIVLSLLEQQPRHGYELAKLIEARSQGKLEFHVASLYPMLYRLESKGWAEGRWVEKANERRRRFYKITPQGKKDARGTAQELARIHRGAPTGHWNRERLTRRSRMPEWKQFVRTHLPPLRVRPERECEIIEELAAQLDQAYREALAGGMEAGQAERLAAEQFQDWNALAREIERSEPANERPPSAKVEWLVRGIPGDVRYALRGMGRSPMFAFVAVATLALGIGGCTAIFSLLDAVVLRPIDYREPDQLVMVWESNVKRGFHNNVVAMADFLDWKARSHVFSDLSLILDNVWNLTGRGEPEQITGISVNQRLLPMLGVEPLVGRSFLEEEDRPGGPGVAILSHRLWVKKFGASRDAIGQAITLDGTQRTIVGVLPADFPWLGKALDVLTPVQMPERDWRVKAGRFLRVVGRLKPGVSLTQARNEMAGIARQLETEYPTFNKDWGVDIVPMAEHFAGSAKTALWILMAAVGLVLLIACANVANLLLARAATREREMALRTTLGATSGRLFRQVLIESLVLALSGGLLGGALAYISIRLIQTYGPQDVPRLELAALNLPVAAFAILASFVTGLSFGLVSAAPALRLNLSAALKEGGRGVLNTMRGARLRNMLVVAEISLALVLLTAAGLLLESLLRLSAIPTGFDPHHVLTATISISGKMENGRLVAITHDMVERIRQLPEVENAGFITFLPFAGMGAATGFQVVGSPPYGPGEAPVTDVRVVQPGYFETMRIPLVRGRFFTDEDNRSDQRRTFIVNEALVKQMFGRNDPLGQRLLVQMGDDVPGEIVGVAGDTKHGSLDGSIRPMVYYTHAHLPMSFGSFVVRTRGEPDRLASSVTAAIQEIKKDQPVTDIHSMEQWIGRSIAQRRFQTALLGVFAIVALILAMIGVYGVMSYSVEQRTHEIGVRLAVGADPEAVRRWITAQGMTLALIGLALGLVGAAASTRVLKSLLYEVHPSDPLTFVATAALLVLVCFAAVHIPARRATRVDPLVALRWE